MKYRKTLVATTINDPRGIPAGGLMMLDSAERQGIEVTVFGSCRPFENWWLSKCLRLWEEIGTWQDYEHIVFCDGTDLLWLAPLEELFDGFDAYGRDFMIASEYFSWPCGFLTDHPAFGTAHYRYPQAGFWMATWPAFLRTFAALFALPHDVRRQETHQTMNNCDQGRYALGMASGALDVAADVDQRLSQCLYRRDGIPWDQNPDLDWTDPRRPRNRLTGSRPCTVHLNGPDKSSLPALFARCVRS